VEDCFESSSVLCDLLRSWSLRFILLFNTCSNLIHLEVRDNNYNTYSNFPHLEVRLLRLQGFGDGLSELFGTFASMSPMVGEDDLGI
jgi:hypothetical protein